MVDGNSAAERQYQLEQDRLDKLPQGTEEQAIQSIVDDYLLLGLSYPKKGGRNCVTAGMFLQEALDEDEIEAALTGMAYGCGQEFSDQCNRMEKLCRDGLPAWLQVNHSDLIERRQEELTDEMREDA